MLSLRKDQEKRTVLPRSLAELPSFAVGVVFVGVVLAFQPYGLDQFLLPKALVLLVGTALVVGVVLVGRPFAGADAFLIGLVLTFGVWSMTVPLVHVRNRTLHAFGALEVLLLVVLFGGAMTVRAAGPWVERRLICLLALPALIIAPLAVAQGLGIDPLRLVFDLGSTRPGRWKVLTTLGNPTWTAELLVLSVPLVLAAWKFAGRSRGIWHWAVGLFFVAAVAVTGSRGALVGLAVVVVVSVRMGLIAAGRRPRWAGFCGVIALGVLVMVMGVGRLGELKPLTGRLGLWAAGVHLVGQEPMTGSGLRHTALILPEGLEAVAAGLDSEYHRWLPTILVDRLDQDLLQVAVERGLPAAFLILLIWCRALMVSSVRYRREGNPVDGAVVAILVTFAVLSLFSAPFHTPATAALFWIAVGLGASRPSDCPQQGERDLALWTKVVPVVVGFAGAGFALGVTLPILQLNGDAGTGHRLLVDRRYDEASAVLRPVTATSPWLTFASIDHARALVASGRGAEALILLADAEEWADSEWIWATRTRALVQLSLEDEARRELEKGLRVLPRSPVLLEAEAELGLQETPRRVNPPH